LKGKSSFGIKIRGKLFMILDNKVKPIIGLRCCTFHTSKYYYFVLTRGSVHNDSALIAKVQTSNNNQNWRYFMKFPKK
jgi:hypothetical protein